MTNTCPSCFHENSPGDRYCIVCGTSLTPSLGFHLPVGALLKQETYQITNFIGRGAFGITYAAIYRPKNARVAIKELWSENGYRQGTSLVWPDYISPVSQQEQIRKFKLEAAYLQRCNSPYIAKVYDCFEANDTIYMVMQLIEGIPLSQVVKAEKALEEARVIHYSLQIAHALAEVHQNNLLHRDIKPENIMLDRRNCAILIDFGTAREFIAGKTGDMTRILTPEYAPIEQYLSRTKRLPATDIYALCASMYELLTGTIPTPSLERANSLSQGLPDPLVPPRQLNPNISTHLEGVILKGMSFPVEQRIQTARDLIEAIGQNPRSPNSTTPPTPPRLCATQLNPPKAEFPLNGVAIVGISHPHNSPVNIDLKHFFGGETVSLQHAKIYPDSGGWMVKDLGSTNGTFIKPNGHHRFHARITTPTRLNPGDEIAFGKVKLSFKIPQ